MARTHAPAVMATALLVILSCAPAVLNVQVNLVTTSCQSGNEPLSGGAVMRWTVFGSGLNSQTYQSSTTAGASGSVTIPVVPIGSDRIIVAELFDASNNLVARGSTGPVNITGTGSRELTMFLQSADSFVYANSASNPTACTTLETARAFHTATVLESGKVLVAGGYSLTGGQPQYLSSTEIYDPETGTVTPGPSLAVARAHHTATHIPGTSYTIVAGGESGSGAAGGALGVGELYDESANTFTRYEMITARTRQVAAAPLPIAGASQPAIAFLMGGNTYTGAPIGSVEFFEISSGFTAATNLTLAATTEAAAVPIAGGVLTFGGWAGSAAQTDILGVTSPDNQTFSRFSGSTLPGGLVFPLAASLGSDILVMDGFTTNPASDETLTAATNAAYLVGSGSTTPTSIPDAPVEARGFGSIATLLNGAVLVGGGGAGNPAVASATADVISVDSSNQVMSASTSTSMNDARIGAAFTTLQDGSVLVTGGYQPTGPATLATIEVYQPAYTVVGNDPVD